MMCPLLLRNARCFESFRKIITKLKSFHVVGVAILEAVLRVRLCFTSRFSLCLYSFGGEWNVRCWNCGA